MNETEIKKISIHKSLDLMNVIHRLAEGNRKFLIVLDDENTLYGVLTDGDIRRWILRRGEVKGFAWEICNRNPTLATLDYKLEEQRQMMLAKNIQAIPIVDGNNRVIDILFWENIFGESHQPLKKATIPLVVMAGGKGTRLDPFTRILPKPLVPIGRKPVIELIIDNFRRYGISEIYISVNHMSKMIKAYFEEFNVSDIHYIEEDSPLGTAGSLCLLKNRITTDFFVTNCDILITADYAEILDYHVEHDNFLTIVGAIKSYHIPYGICEIEESGSLKRILEKPKYDFIVNTGMYVLAPNCLDMLEDSCHLDMPDLISRISEIGRIGVFPVSGESWLDIGEWDEYKKTVKRLTVA